MLSRAALLFSLVLVTAAAGSPQYTAQIVLASAKDFILSGGATITNAGCPSGSISLRSGSPTTVSMAAATTALSPGITIQSVALSYQYEAGYAGDTATKMTVHAAGSTIYTSPALDKYNYTKQGGFSPPVAVDATGLDIAVSGGAARVEMVFANNDRNGDSQLTQP